MIEWPCKDMDAERLEMGSISQFVTQYFFLVLIDDIIDLLNQSSYKAEAKVVLRIHH